MSEAQSHSSRADVVHDFILNNPNFICPWGKESAEEKKIHYMELPPRDQRMNRVRTIQTAFPVLDAKKADALVFIANKVTDHAQGYNHAWDFWAECQIATKLLEEPHRDVNDVANTAETFSQIIRTTKNWDLYFDSGISFKKVVMHLISMNPLYEEKHPLWAPDFIHVLTRNRDVERARAADYHEHGIKYTARDVKESVLVLPRGTDDKTRSAEMHRRQKENGIPPFIPGLPYHIPGDPEMDGAPITRTMKLLEESVPLLRGKVDFRQLAIDILMDKEAPTGTESVEQERMRLAALIMKNLRK